MIDSLSYRQKFLGILALFVVMLIVSYSLAFKKTIRIIANHNQLSDSLNVASRAPEGIKKYELMLFDINTNLERYESVSENAHEYVLAIIGAYCDSTSAKVSRYPEVKTKNLRDILINTHTIQLEGPFKDITRLIYELEYQQKIGRISSVKYEMLQDRSSRKEILTATVYLENIRFQENSI